MVAVVKYTSVEHHCPFFSISLAIKGFIPQLIDD